MRLNILLSLFILLLGLTACEKDKVTEEIIATKTTLSGETVNSSFFGRVKDQHGNPVSNALITIGASSTKTDQQGLWEINNATVVEDQAYILVSAQQYMTGSRTLFAKENQKYNVDLQLIKKDNPINISSSVGGQVSVPNSDAKINFEANSFVLQDGSIYSGAVSVHAFYLDPTDRNTYEQMPGDLRATNSNNEAKVLITYGMLAVELEGSNGEKLQLGNDKKAKLQLPIPSEASSTAPNEIPLWFFDEAKATWIEEGKAVRNGDIYEGNVSHFTFWNVDVPGDFIKLCGSIAITNNGNQIFDNVVIKLINKTWGTSISYTDSLGTFCGMVPKDETFTIEVYGNSLCFAPTYTSTIGPFTSDTNLGVISIPSPGNPYVTITGKAVCNGTAFSEGCAVIQQDNRIINIVKLNANGDFSTSLFICDKNQDISIYTVNYNEFSQSPPVSYSAASDINTGSLESCQQGLSNFFKITDNNGQTNLLPNCVVSISQNSILSINASSTQDSLISANASIYDLTLPLTTGTITLTSSRNALNYYDMNTQSFKMVSLVNATLELLKVAPTGNGSASTKGIIITSDQAIRVEFEGPTYY